MTLDLKALAVEVGDVIDQASTIPFSDLNTLHVDGDYAAYFFSGNDETPLGTARKVFADSVLAAGAAAGVYPKNIYVHITDPMSDKGQRYRIATVRDYQEKRTHSQRPKNWQGLRDYMHNGMIGTNYTVVNWSDREADDGAAAMGAQDIEHGRHPAYYYRDKDWKHFAGLHVRWEDFMLIRVHVDDFEVVVPRDEEPDYYGPKFFWLQMLMGDSVDGIPGLERIMYINAKGKESSKLCGEKCAEAVLTGINNNADAYRAVAGAYSDFYGPGWQLRFAEQAMLLWMRRRSAAVDDYMQIIPAQYVDSFAEANKFIKKRIKL